MSLWVRSFDKLQKISWDLLTYKYTWLYILVSLLIVIPVFALHASAETGVYLLAVAIIILMWLALRYKPAHKIAIVGVILPTSYLLTLCLPQQSDSTKMAWLYGSMLVLSLIYRYFFIQDTPKRAKKPIKKNVFDYAIALPQVLIIGVVLGGLASILLPQVQLFTTISLPLTVGAVMAFALIETMYFQGLLQATLAELTSSRFTVILTTLLFACLSAYNPTSLVVAICAGGSMALIYQLERSVLLTMAANITFKVTFLYIVLFI